MTRTDRYGFVAHYFALTMVAAESELVFGDEFELLVAVILSAQCTDKRVNMVTPALFSAFPTSRDLAQASVEAVFDKIRSVSYPNAKAAHLVSMARSLVERFGGHVPSTRAELESLSGVGRKTAGVVLSVAFGQNEIPVDTHVFRVARRLGLAPMTAKTPEAVEKHLIKGFSAIKTIDSSSMAMPPNLLGVAHHWLILHGRYICTARKPKCEDCGLRACCKFYDSQK